MSATQELLRFGIFELNLAIQELRKNGTPVKMPPLPFKLLALLAGHAGQIVTRQEIQEKLWGAETFVDFEQGVNKCIKQIRTALSDNADNPLYIETLPRQGYRFLPPVVSKTIAAPGPKVVESKSGIPPSPGEAKMPEKAPKAETYGAADGALPSSNLEPVSLAGKTVSHYRVPNVTGDGGDLHRLKRDPDSGRFASLIATGNEESGTSTGPKKSSHAISTPVTGRPYAKIVAVVAVVAVIALAVFFWQSKRQVVPAASATNPTTVAVLPFQNLGSDKDADFLRLALPDEIATALSYVRSLSIRPFATTSKYTAAGLDLQQVGREMRVSDIVTGHYLKEGDQLQITLEAVDVENNRTLWRDTLNAAAPDMIAMRSQITAKVREGMIPALGASTDSGETSTRPKNEEAYDLYLRSLALPHDPGPNKEAIPMLERAVGLDPTYAPAWANLGRRYYLDSQYGGGGEAMFQKSNTALERALALDPNLTLARGQSIANRTERGELVKAYQDAANWVESQPKNATAHFVLGYVLRYAGLLDESARACEDALALDSGNYLFRGCATTFSQMGSPERAMDFSRLDPGSTWSNSNMIWILVREGKLSEASAAVQKMSSDDDYTKFDKACLDRPSPTPSAELDRAVRVLEALREDNPDPENRYLFAADMAFCGEKDKALRLLKSAIEGKYCAYTALQKDPLLAPLRGTPEFTQLLSAAKQCHADFLAERTRGLH